MARSLFVILFLALLQQCLCEEQFVEGGQDLETLTDRLYGRETRQANPDIDLDSLIDSVFKPPGPTDPVQPNPTPNQPYTPNTGDGGNQVTEPITGPNGCICVPYYLCSSNKSVITDGVGLIDIRSAILSHLLSSSKPQYKPCSCSRFKNNKAM